MDFELPALPKAFVINSALIAAILLGALIAIVGFWTFLPLFMGPVPAKQASSLAVNFSYLHIVSPGMAWDINGTATNPSNKTLADIKVRVFSDGNVAGYELAIPTLAAGESKSFTLHPRIKPSAELGNFTVQTVVSVPNTFPAEYELGISIVRETGLQQYAATTAAGLAALFKQRVAAGVKYTITKDDGTAAITYLKGDKSKVVSIGGATETTLLFDGVNSYMIVNGTAYNMGPGGDSTNYLEIMPGAKVVGSEMVNGEDAAVIEQKWEDKSLNGTSDNMLTKLWYWKDEGMPLKAELYRNGKLDYTIAVSNIVFGGVTDSDFKLPAGMEVKPFIQLS